MVGGGIAGLASAIELALAGAGVVVAEATGAPTERFGETLAPGVLARLDRLGLSEVFRSAGHLSCPGTAVCWGSDRIGHNDFVLDPHGPAWHIDRSRFELMLRARAVQLGVEVLPATRVVDVEESGTRTVAAVRSPSGAPVGTRTVSARWLIDASGPTAWLARRRDVGRVVIDRLVALVRIAAVAGSFTAQTLVESTPEGWWYAARIPADRLVTVFVTEPRSARALISEGWAGWHWALGATRLLADRLADAGVTAEGAAFRVGSIGVSRLSRVAGERWLAVGDAAAQLDPIAGRGIHDALGDAGHAARLVAESLRGGRPAIAEFGDRVHARFAEHLTQREGWYDVERQWPAAPFWRHRAAGLLRARPAATVR
ncbi:NAD(P)/FAD-dependent oxidoreductase [Microlunatus ginsengisoli]|uniref:Tryptophan 7-halogenase n=1 Tax=Microlunatus ginsengisoli TaxID=363863 RepID=A0ABP6ZE87_9ACTN